MDEAIFRTSQWLEHFQIQFIIVMDGGKILFQEYSQQLKEGVVYVWNNISSIRFQTFIKDLWDQSKEIFGQIHIIFFDRCIYFCTSLVSFIKYKWTSENVYTGCVGFILGGLVGFGVGSAIQRRHRIVQHSKAIQCFQYRGVESVDVVEDAIVPRDCQPNEILVRVKASSVHVVDAQICKGYGHKIRTLLSGYHHYSEHDLPVTLGRDCTGIVISIGSNVKRLEIGDQVWLTVPFWAQGTMSETLIVPETAVSHKPNGIGYEAACSLPYAGTIALNLLKTAGLDDNTSKDKRVLIQEGCTPVGCILTQILKLWEARVTTVCFKRAAPVAKALGAREIIALSENETIDEGEKLTLKKVYLEELKKIDDKFDVVIITKDFGLDAEEFQFICKRKNYVFSSVPVILKSDSFGSLRGFIFWIYTRIKILLSRKAVEDSFSETHMCYVVLERLKELVDGAKLQTVVDKVYRPTDIKLALGHIQSYGSIGSTVITFR